MARIRTVKPEFWTDSFMVQLDPLARLVYVALWTAADDHGYIADEPERLAMELMPREDPLLVDGIIQMFWAADRLERYLTESGRTYYRVSKWEQHQRPSHPAASKILRESSRKLAIPLRVRRDVAEKYGCPPGSVVDAQCYYCGAVGQVHWFKLYNGRPSSWVTFPGLELDHFVAESRSGCSEAENMVLACRTCNRRKRDADPLDFIIEQESSRILANPPERSRVLPPEQGTGNREQGSPLHTQDEITRGVPQPVDISGWAERRRVP